MCKPRTASIQEEREKKKKKQENPAARTLIECSAARVARTVVSYWRETWLLIVTNGVLGLHMMGVWRGGRVLATGGQRDVKRKPPKRIDA